MVVMQWPRGVHPVCLVVLLVSAAASAPQPNLSAPALRPRITAPSESRRNASAISHGSAVEAKGGSGGLESGGRSFWDISANIEVMIKDDLYKGSARSQWINAAVGAAFGASFVYDGVASFKLIVSVAVFIFCGTVAMHAGSDAWDLPKESILRQLIGLEAGTIGAAATYFGFEGVKTVLGAVVGWQAAHLTTDLMSNKNEIIKGQIMYEWFLYIFYTLYIVGGIRLVHKERLLGYTLSVVCPLAGAVLFTASLSFTLTELWLWLPYSMPLTPEPGPWIAFVANLGWFPVLKEVEDVGIFANSPYNFSVRGRRFELDHLVGNSLVLLIAVLGIMVQLRSLKRKEFRVARMDSLNQKLKAEDKPAFLRRFLKKSSAGTKKVTVSNTVESIENAPSLESPLMGS